MRRLLGAAAAVLLCLFLVPAALAQSQYQSQSIDDQALAIANELQCPVCQNVTVAYSNSTLAAEMRQVIRDKLTQGQTHDQIIQYFVDRYGEGILTSPPKHGLNLLVWLLPAAGLLLGLGTVLSVLRSRKPVSEAEPGVAPLSDEDERLLEQALRGAD
jgi:cytochrome c-type biogenesis protein CcmH